MVREKREIKKPPDWKVKLRGDIDSSYVSGDQLEEIQEMVYIGEGMSSEQARQLHEEVIKYLVC